MVIVHLENVSEFARKYANARRGLEAWKFATQKAVWKKKQDVLSDFPKAKMIANNRARFEIAHNLFRLVAEIDYDDQLVKVRFIGTHNEYDKIDPATI